MKKPIFILLYILLISIFLSSFIAITKGDSGLRTSAPMDLNFSFEENVFFESNNLTAETTFNINNITQYSKIYNATYSFTDDIIGGDPSGWFVDEGGGTANIIGELDGHDKVLELNDTNDAHDVYCIQFLSENRTYGGIEFWMRTNDTTKESWFQLFDNDIAVNRFAIKNANFQYYDGNWHVITEALDNTWYHIKIFFECSGSGYKGLAQYRWRVFINGVEYGDYGFHNNRDEVDWVLLRTIVGHFNYLYYIDAVGYDWDNYYDINDNIIPLYNITQTRQIKDFTFAHNEQGNLLEIGESYSYYGWSEIDIGGDYVNVYGSAEDYDREIMIFHDEITNDIGIEKDDFSETTRLMNITFDIGLISITNVDTEYLFEVYSYDSTLLVKLKFVYEPPFKLYYYDGASYQLLDTLTTDYLSYYAFNLYINEFCVLRYYNEDESPDYQNYYFPKIANKKGLSKIKIHGTMPDTTPACYLSLDNVGVHINGTSIAQDFYSQIYDIYNETNNLYKYRTNFINYNISGYTALTLQDDDSAYSYPLDAYRFLNDTIEQYNLYGLTTKFGAGLSSRIYKPVLILVSNDTTIPTLNYVKIHGVKLTESINTYYPYFTNSSIVDIQNNYFYYSGGKLRHILNISHFGQPEYLDVKFDIDNLGSINRTFTFVSIFNGIGLNYLRVNYTSDKSSLYEYNTHGSATQTILPQDQIIDSISILITDNNNDSYNGSQITGWVKEISLIYIPNISLSITTIGLLNMLIPLLIILVPTLALRKVMGKAYLIPIFILLSIVVYAGGSMPLWLLFIIIVSLGILGLVEGKSDIKGDKIGV